MAQISKLNFETSINRELYKQLLAVLAASVNIEKINLLLSELLTNTEKVMLTKRLAIALLLENGYSYRNIRYVLHVSFPTIRSVQFWLNHGNQGYKEAVHKIIMPQIDKNFFNKIDLLIDNSRNRADKRG